MSKTACLDHIIILVPYKDIVNPPAWLTKDFSVTPGGVHADGKTANKLITFQDGAYLELIAFVNDDPRNKEGHWWGQKNLGIIDFAFTTDEDAGTHYEKLSKRLAGSEGSASYAPPKAGGRKRDDGQELKWEVTFPNDVKRGQLPFFCHDVTSRKLRVPSAPENVEHPSKTYGVKSLTIILPKDRFIELVKSYPAILNIDDSAQIPNVVAFPVSNVNPVKDRPQSTIYIRYPGDGEDELRKLVAEQGVVLTDLVLGGFESHSRRKLDAQNELGGVFLEG
ncbi:glyoxalase-like domain-containing protein [Xylogone sp. PMI_703]|nr:glyoxalase-like domain-containing protein [Xylogone sp. PMI_703]